ncbi:MAG: O-antigen ligase family protein [Pseudoxanthomonas sp.]|nr:O-antigen ligase family protein [Pseudoxanthomonas sp.]
MKGMLGVRDVGSVTVIVIFLSLGNLLASQSNNWNISLVQIAFLFGSILCLRPSLHETRGFNVTLLLICLSIATSNALAAWDGAGLADWGRVLNMIAHLAFAVAVFYWFAMKPDVLRWVVGAQMLATLVYFCVLVGFWLRLEEPYSYYWFSTPPLFNHIRHVGMFLCVSVVTASWAVLACGGAWRWLGWAIYVLALSMLLWSGGRGAFLAACGGVAVLGLKFAPNRDFRPWAMLFIGMMLAFIFSAIFDVGQNGLGWLPAIRRSVAAASMDQLASSRLTIWMHLLPYIGERPWFGWGGEGFRFAWAVLPTIQAHNGLFQLLIEWGVVGTSLVLGLLGWIAIKGGLLYWKTAAMQPRDASLPLGMALVTALSILSLVDGVFYHGTPMAFLMLGFGVVAASLYLEKGRSKDGLIARS